MRRSWTEWLLVPLFLLPLAGVAGFSLVRRATYFAELESYRRQGLAAFYRGPVPASEPDLVARFLRANDLDGGATEGYEARVEGPGARLERLFVRLPRAEGTPRVWRFSTRYPGSLPAKTLAREDVRLALETGRPPVDFAEADPAARRFARLAQDPGLKPLAAAPLPVSTKLFLLDRSRPGARPVERMLRSLRAWLPPRARPPGLYRRDGADTVLLVGGADRPDVIAPAPAPAAPQIWHEERRGNVRLVVGEGIDDTGRFLWRGRRDRPLAATWALQAVHGDRWWKDERFARWIAPVGLAALAFLFIPLLLAAALRRRKAIDAARLRFLTEIAHDLRTPLAVVRLHAEMLASGRAPEEKRERYAATLARGSTRLSALLANLLDFTQLERGKRPFRLEPIAVAEAAAAAADDFQALYPERAGCLSLHGPAELRVEADRTALVRCLANLLDNAGKFTPPQTPIEVRWRAGPEGVSIEVADSGGGIPRAEAGRVFRRYRRGAAAQRAAVPGTGLGLSLVRDLVRGMRGEVFLEPSEKGAVFVLRLREAGDG